MGEAGKKKGAAQVQRARSSQPWRVHTPPSLQGYTGAATIHSACAASSGCSQVAVLEGSGTSLTLAGLTPLADSSSSRSLALVGRAGWDGVRWGRRRDLLLGGQAMQCVAGKQGQRVLQAGSPAVSPLTTRQPAAAAAASAQAAAASALTDRPCCSPLQPGRPRPVRLGTGRRGSSQVGRRAVERSSPASAQARAWRWHGSCRWLAALPAPTCPPR